MLDAATAMVERSGLTVSLDHIRFEDVIRDAGVSRSAGYRRWPYKDLFFSDLLLELASAATPAAESDGSALELVRAIAAAHPAGFDTATGRHELCLELLRHGAAADFATIHGSSRWRTYLALHATFQSLADGTLRDDVRTALAAAEQGFIDRIAGVYAQVTGLLGYRLRPELHASHRTLATVANATLRGLLLMAQSTPAVAEDRIDAAPLGAAETASWSLAGLGIAAVAMAFLEPDPTVEWNAERVAAARSALGG
ncbi:hypothetical protein [Pseudonocardia sp. GCM10023141]|uniref:hypothetical protein n=1 Tax=Pseudonocardia sp. GCM10023141 TaxID=3252653 RepID=UPI003610CD99